jgi:DNA-binding NtrC family response regulator
VKRILIIEDSKGQQIVYKHWFSDHSLDFCDNIYDASLLVETKDYDVILLDLHLGESESGLSFMENFEIKDGKPKVIVVSAYIYSLTKPVMKKKENIVWLDKEEATQERLMKEMGLKEDS